jgi:hypothetical protein
MTRKLKLASLVAVLALALTGCWKHAYNVGTGAPNGTQVYKKWQTHWAWGLAGTAQADVKQHCPSGNATIKSQATFLQGLIRGLTAGIYGPVTVEILCADGRSSSIELKEETVSQIVNDPRFLDWVAEEAPEQMPEVLAALHRPQEPAASETALGAPPATAETVAVAH